MRIGFLFNHDRINQIAHNLPIALAPACENVDAEIIPAVTNPALAIEVRRLQDRLVAHMLDLASDSSSRRVALAIAEFAGVHAASSVPLHPGGQAEEIHPSLSIV